MRINEVAKLVGVTTETLRYYERIGVIPPVPKNESGMRVFSHELLVWIEQVLNLKAAGVSLENIIEYVRLAELGDQTVEFRRELLIEQRETINQKIKILESSLEILDGKIEHYYQSTLPKTTETLEAMRLPQEEKE